jgi:hypothetical protein
VQITSKSIGKAVYAEYPARKFSDRGHVERFENDTHAVPSASRTMDGIQEGSPASFLPTVRTNNDQTSSVLSEKEAQELRRTFVGPVHVLEDKNEWRQR